MMLAPQYHTDRNATSPEWLAVREHLSACGAHCNHVFNATTGDAFSGDYGAYLSAFPVRVATADSRALMPLVCLYVRQEGGPFAEMLLPPVYAMELAKDLLQATMRLDPSTRDAMWKMLMAATTP